MQAAFHCTSKEWLCRRNWSRKYRQGQDRDCAQNTVFILIPITVEHSSLGWVESKCASAIERSDQLVLKGNAGQTHSLPGAGWKGSVRFRIITAIINITSSKTDRHAELQQVVIAIYVV